MNIAVVHDFAAPRQKLWDLLLDPARLASCIPGCEELREAGPDRYTATLKIGVAAIKGTYTGKVEIGEKQPPEHYKLSVEGSAAPGFVRGVATMDLAESGPQSTRLSMNADAQVGGLIASVGQRFLGGIARQMTQQFFRNVEKELEAS
jgi:carbon monoxide dehydrogenase subunit G